MTANIQTIFFDVGNTLRIVLPDQEFIDRAEAGLMELIGTTESHDALFAKLEERWKAYRKQSKGSLLVITHSTKILEALPGDYTHVMVNGKIVKTSDSSLIDEVNENGFAEFENA